MARAWLLLVIAGCPAPAPSLRRPPPPPPHEVPTAPARPVCVTEPTLLEVGDDVVSGLSVGDLSGDGVPDLAILHDAPRGKDYVSVLTVWAGDGHGGFSEGASVDVGHLTIEASLGDVDEDGHLDAVLPQYREKSIAIVRSDGAGHLAKPIEIATVRRPTHVAVLDLDRDGHLDLLVSSQEHLQVFRGDGSTRFHAGKPIQVGQAPDWPVATDVDRDGIPDLYVPTNDDAHFTVLRGDGKDGFTPVLTTDSCASPSFPRVGDLDRDGIPDVAYVCVHATSANVEIRIARGTDAVDTRHLDADPTDAIELADFDSDGALDLVTMGQADALGPTQLRVFGGDGTGGFSQLASATFDGKLGDPVLADVDGDGKLDLIGSDWSGHPPARIAIWSGGPLGTDRCATAPESDRTRPNPDP